MGTATKQQNKVPKLRFSEFTKSWETKTLGDCFEIKSASRVHKDEWTKDGVRFFRSSDVVSQFNGTENNEAFISCELYEKLSEKSGKVSAGDLLVTGGGSIGIPYLINSNDPLYFKDADLLWFRSGDSVNGFFLYSFLRTEVFKKYLKSISHIGTISHYTIEQAKSTPIVLPEFSEQQKIADFLGSVDAWIDNLRSQKTALETYKAGCMQKIFTQQVRFKDENGKNFPEWEECSFLELFKSVSIRDHQLGRDSFLESGTYPIIDQGKDYISGYSNDKGLLMKDFPVIIFGDHTTITKYVDFEFIVGADGARVLSNKRNDSKKFLYYLLLANPLEVEGYKRHFSILKQKKYSLPVDKTEQQKIADFLTAIDQTITAKAGEITKVVEWKKGLMQTMFI